MADKCLCLLALLVTFKKGLEGTFELSAAAPAAVRGGESKSMILVSSETPSSEFFRRPLSCLWKLFSRLGKLEDRTHDCSVTPLSSSRDADDPFFGSIPPPLTFEAAENDFAKRPLSFASYAASKREGKLGWCRTLG